MTQEQRRIELLIQRDGEAAAREWVRRTLESYRQALQSPASHASLPEYRWRFEQSIREFEDWLATGRLPREQSGEQSDSAP